MAHAELAAEYLHRLVRNEVPCRPAISSPSLAQRKRSERSRPSRARKPSSVESIQPTSVSNHRRCTKSTRRKGWAKSPKRLHRTQVLRDGLPDPRSKRQRPCGATV